MCQSDVPVHLQCLVETALLLAQYNSAHDLESTLIAMQTMQACRSTPHYKSTVAFQGIIALPEKRLIPQPEQAKHGLPASHGSKGLGQPSPFSGVMMSIEAFSPSGGFCVSPTLETPWSSQ